MSSYEPKVRLVVMPQSIPSSAGKVAGSFLFQRESNDTRHVSPSQFIPAGELKGQTKVLQSIKNKRNNAQWNKVKGEAKISVEKETAWN